MAFFPISCNSQKQKVHDPLGNLTIPLKAAISMEIPRDNGKGFQEENHCIQRAAKTCAHQLWTEFSEPYGWAYLYRFIQNESDYSIERILV